MVLKLELRPANSMQAFISGIVEIGGLGLKAWQLRRPKVRSSVPATDLDPTQQTSSHSLLRGLLLMCVVYQGFAWIHSSWQVSK